MTAADQLAAGAAYHQLTQTERAELVASRNGDRHDDVDDRRCVSGGSFILDAPEVVPAVWGEDDRVLWAQGEPLVVCGPPGVGKTTVANQLTMGRLGIVDSVLGMPVTPGRDRVLYLACDRPRQVARAMRRLVGEEHRSLLDTRLAVWKGPPPADLSKRPEVLVQLARRFEADTVVIDSLKDVAIGIAEDAVGAALNNALQSCIAADIEVCALHHQRKGQDGRKPNKLEDLYGSVWIPAGAGSVVLLWGQAGNSIVELVHLKQPAATVGPWKIEHDHAAGVTTVSRGFDVWRFLTMQRDGTTVADVARAQVEGEPTENERKSAHRALERLFTTGRARRVPAKKGGTGGTQPARYYAVDDTRNEAQ